MTKVLEKFEILLLYLVGPSRRSELLVRRFESLARLSGPNQSSKSEVLLSHANQWPANS